MNEGLCSKTKCKPGYICNAWTGNCRKCVSFGNTFMQFLANANHLHLPPYSGADLICEEFKKRGNKVLFPSLFKPFRFETKTGTTTRVTRVETKKEYTKELEKKIADLQDFIKKGTAQYLLIENENKNLKSTNDDLQNKLKDTAGKLTEKYEELFTLMEVFVELGKLVEPQNKEFESLQSEFEKWRKTKNEINLKNTQFKLNPTEFTETEILDLATKSIEEQKAIKELVERFKEFPTKVISKSITPLYTLLSQTQQIMEDYKIESKYEGKNIIAHIEYNINQIYRALVQHIKDLEKQSEKLEQRYFKLRNTAKQREVSQNLQKEEIKELIEKKNKLEQELLFVENQRKHELERHAHTEQNSQELVEKMSSLVDEETEPIGKVLTLLNEEKRRLREARHQFETLKQEEEEKKSLNSDEFLEDQSKALLDAWLPTYTNNPMYLVAKTETEFPASLFVAKALKGQLKPSEDEMAKNFLRETVKPEDYGELQKLMQEENLSPSQYLKQILKNLITESE